MDKNEIRDLKDRFLVLAEAVLSCPGDRQIGALLDIALLLQMAEKDSKQTYKRIKPSTRRGV